jgi:hypothetical protein
MSIQPLSEHSNGAGRQFVRGLPFLQGCESAGRNSTVRPAALVHGARFRRCVLGETGRRIVLPWRLSLRSDARSHSTRGLGPPASILVGITNLPGSQLAVSLSREGTATLGGIRVQTKKALGSVRTSGIAS